MDPCVGKRIIVVGSSNSGKSTFAEQLAGKLDVPFIELDALFWEPNWVGAEREVFRERVRKAIQPESWVMAGNYSAQQDLSWPVADTVIWLDLPLATVLRRCVGRTWRRWRSQELIWGTNRESFWRHIMLWNPEKSLIAFTAKTYRRRRRMLLECAHDPRWSHLTFIRLRTPDAIAAFLESISATQARELVGSGLDQRSSTSDFVADDRLACRSLCAILSGPVNQK